MGSGIGSKMGTKTGIESRKNLEDLVVLIERKLNKLTGNDKNKKKDIDIKKVDEEMTIKLEKKEQAALEKERKEKEIKKEKEKNKETKKQKNDKEFKRLLKKNTVKMY